MAKKSVKELDALIDSLEYKEIQDFAKSEKEKHWKPIVEKLLRVMEEEGISEQELAKRVGKQRKIVQRLIDDTANVSLDLMLSVALAMGRTLKVDFVKPDKNQEEL